MPDETNIDFWGEPESELLEHKTKGEAIEKIIYEKQMDLGGEKFGLLDTLEIVGYRRRVVSEKEKQQRADTAIEDLMGSFYEEHGDPYGDDHDDPTDETCKAAKDVFVKLMGELYVWYCDPVEETKDVINICHWLETEKEDG